MPWAKLLSEQKRAVIVPHHRRGENQTDILILPNRHIITVRRILKNPKPVATPPANIPNRKLSDRDVHYIHQLAVLAVRAQKSAVEI